MTFKEAIDQIARLPNGGWRDGRSRLAEFLIENGIERSFSGQQTKFIHVAGTNGKGSTTAFAESILCAHGVSTGGFYSPYVVDPRERIQLNKDLISKRDFANLTAELLACNDDFIIRNGNGLSEFEFKTAMAFTYWDRKRPDWAVVEVGLGGRLDATNILTPAASIVVSIGLDHVQILGGTEAKIAVEKAGIIKAGRPVVIGEMSEEARTEVLRIATEKGSPVKLFGRDFDTKSRADGTVDILTKNFEVLNVSLGIRGYMQEHNASLAVMALLEAGFELDLEQTKSGLRTASVPARFTQMEFGGHTFLIDGAHNAPSAERLVKALAKEYSASKQFCFVMNMVGGHSPSAFFTPLLPIMKQTFCPPIDFHRAVSPREMVETLSEAGHEALECSSLTVAIRKAIAASEGHPIIVTGSFYLAGDVIRWLNRRGATGTKLPLSRL